MPKPDFICATISESLKQRLSAVSRRMGRWPNCHACSQDLADGDKAIALRGDRETRYYHIDRWFDHFNCYRNLGM